MSNNFNVQILNEKPLDQFKLYTVPTYVPALSTYMVGLSLD